MNALSQIPPPLPPDQPPTGYDWKDVAAAVAADSDVSGTTAFRTGLNLRDIFLGQKRCIICGLNIDRGSQHCHIIPQREDFTWIELRERNWIPAEAKQNGQHEPRNGLLLCPTHHQWFDDYIFFIRYMPDDFKFILINFSDYPALRQFHGKAIALDTKDHYCPFPSLFLIHEMRVRGHNPFDPIDPLIPAQITWQDWILTDGVFDRSSNSFIRTRQSGITHLQPLTPITPATTSTQGALSGATRHLGSSPKELAAILAATCAAPTWKGWLKDNMSWEGTAEENTQKYLSAAHVEQTQMREEQGDNPDLGSVRIGHEEDLNSRRPLCL